MNAVNQARASLPFRPTGCSTRAFESFATMSSPSRNVNDAPTRKAGTPPFFPITPGPRRHFPLPSGAAPLSNFKALHKLQRIHKVHKLHKSSKALWVGFAQRVVGGHEKISPFYYSRRVFIPSVFIHPTSGRGTMTFGVGVAAVMEGWTSASAAWNRTMRAPGTYE